MLKLRKSKRGSVLDLLLIPALLFMIVVFLIVSFMVFSKVNSTNIFSTNAQADKAMDDANQTFLNMDNMIMFVLVGLSLFTIISGFLFGSHPVMFFFSIFFLIISIITAAALSNAYDTFDAQSQISTYSDQFPKVSFIMSKLPFYMVFMGFATLIAMYAGWNKYG